MGKINNTFTEKRFNLIDRKKRRKKYDIAKPTPNNNIRRNKFNRNNKKNFKLF